MNTPFISMQARVSIDTHERRLRLQQMTGLSIPKLLDLAFRNYEEQLNKSETPHERQSPKSHEGVQG